MYFVIEKNRIVYICIYRSFVHIFIILLVMFNLLADFLYCDNVILLCVKMFR